MAAPPTNDLFATAQAISGNSGSVAGTNVDATGEVGEPDNAGLSAPIQSAWYAWTAPRNGKFLFSTCTGTTFDTTLGAYTGSSVNNLSSVAVDVNSCGTGDSTTPNRVRSAVSFSAVSGSTYHISVDGVYVYNGTFTLSWKPANDDFVDAYVLSGATGSIEGMNPHFTEETDEPDNAGVSDPIQSAWYAWTAPETGQFTFDTCTGTPMDTTLGVYAGTAVNQLSVLAQNDDGCGINREKSLVTFSAVGGTTYHISVDGPDTWTGWFVLKWGNQPPIADLSVEKTDSADPVAVGSHVTYTIVVSNSGPETATDVRVADQMDSTTTFVSHNVTQGTCVTPHVGGWGRVECTLGSIANGASATLTLTVKTTITGNIFDYAVVGSTEGDPTSDDRSDGENTDVLNSPLTDLSVTNTDSADPVPLDSEVTYTMVISNDGPGEGKDVVLENRFSPWFMSFVSYTSTQGTCTPPENGSTVVIVLTCQLGTIANGETATVTLTVSTNHSGNPSTYAEVSTTSGDTDSSNNSSTQFTRITPINLIRNPGFEADSNRDGRPDQWSTNSHFTRRNAVVFSGKFAGRHRAGDNSSYVVQQTVSNVAPETGYSFSAHVKLPTTSDAYVFRIEIRWKNRSNGTIRTDIVPMFPNEDTGWDLASDFPDSPAGAVKAQVRMVVKSLKATIYVDDFLLSR